MAIPAEQCVQLLTEYLAARPEDTYSEEALGWFADVSAIVESYDPITAVTLKSGLAQISNIGMASNNVLSANMRDAACTRFFMETRAILLRLRLETNTFQTAQFQQGQIHHYFDEVRQIISAATRDILFIDPTWMQILSPGMCHRWPQA